MTEEIQTEVEAPKTEQRPATDAEKADVALRDWHAKFVQNTDIGRDTASYNAIYELREGIHRLLQNMKG